MILLVFIIFFALVLLRMPIAFVLGASSIVYILLSGETGYLINVPQRMLAGVNNFTLLAVPFFMLVGDLMNNGGITSRLVGFVRTLIGHFRGGLAYVNILVSAFLSAIIGSANAVAAITSTSIVPEMRKDGYTNEDASAISAASSIMGPIIPPSMVMIIFAVAAGVSVGDLFVGGIIPGLLLAALFLAVAYIGARKNPDIVIRAKSSFLDIVKKFINTLPALSIPVIILVGIISGFFTATEAGAMGCLIAFILGKFVYKELTWKSMYPVLLNSGKVTAGILIIASTASLFGWVMAIEQIPQMVADLLLKISDKPWIILLMINLFLLVVGCFLEPFAAILILVPVLLPVINELGIDLIHFGMMMCLNLVIGMITPPVGLSLFVVSGITKVTVPRLVKSLTPYFAVSLIVLLMVTYLPQITTFLPSLFK